MKNRAPRDVGQIASELRAKILRRRKLGYRTADVGLLDLGRLLDVADPVKVVRRNEAPRAKGA